MQSPKCADSTNIVRIFSKFDVKERWSRWRTRLVGQRTLICVGKEHYACYGRKQNNTRCKKITDICVKREHHGRKKEQYGWGKNTKDRKKNAIGGKVFQWNCQTNTGVCGHQV